MREDDNPFETSIDSGICLDTAPGEENKLKTFQRILFVLDRDQRLRAEQRKRLSQISEKKLKKKLNEEPCNVCCINLDVENIKICIKCINCQKVACRGQECSTWIPSQSGWECKLCNQSNESCSKSSEWLHQQITGRFLSPVNTKSEPSLLRDHHPLEFDRRSETTSSFVVDKKERVRELVEEILGDMLGGSLDNVSISQLNKSREYLPTWENGESPGVSHVKLKRLIERIIQETLHLPTITDQPNHPGPSGDENLPFFDPKKYQELLATAVLNKIVDSYNYEKKFEGNREAISARSDLDKNHNALIGRKEQSGSISSSSIEPESDCSITDPPTNISRCGDFSRSDSGSNIFSDILNRNDPNDSSLLNDFLTRHNVPLPDFSIGSDSSNEDIPDNATTNSIENSWERNWLFKKKRSGQDGSGPVGMLVPCPKEDIKTLIGDRTADEMSDLSEAGSDFEDKDREGNIENPQNVRIQNRTVIGGKSPIGIFDELLEQTSLMSTSSLADGDAVFTETKNDFVLGDDLHNNLGESSAFDPEEAINSLVDTQNLRNNLSKASTKPKDDSTHSHYVNVQIQRPPIALPRSAKKTIYISTKDIPETELTSSSTESPADRTTSTESSSTTTDDTVQSAIETIKTDIDNPNVLVLHKDLFPVPKETYSVSLSLIPLNNNTNREDSSMANESSNDSNTSDSETATTATTTTCPTLLNGSSNKHHTKLETLKHSAFSTQLSDEEDVVGHLSHLMPGSIAEREHKKWYNAVDMPNNPYSKEALKRRLSGTSDKPFDIPNIDPTTLEKASSEDPLNGGGGSDENEINIDENKLDYKRYGRDYYINDAKHASGTSKHNLAASTSFLTCTEDDKFSDKELSPPPTPQPIPRSHSWGDKRHNTADIFAARPVRVEESDPILSKATKLEYLSTPDRDFYLLPTEEISSLRSISTSEHSLSQAGDSLTPSEDSDTIRVYDLKTQETRLLLRDDQVNSTQQTGTNTSGLSVRQQGLRSPLITSQSSSSSSPSPRSFKLPVKSRAVTPSSLRFLQPKRKLFDSRRIMSEDNATLATFDRENSLRSNGTPEKNVIEEDVVSSLPSVKALARAFQNTTQDSSAPVNRPKSTSWKSFDAKPNAQPIASATNGEEKSEPKPPSRDSYSPSYDQKYIPAEPLTEEKVNGSCNEVTATTESPTNVSESCEKESTQPASLQPEEPVAVQSEPIVEIAVAPETEKPLETPEPVTTLLETVTTLPEPVQSESVAEPTAPRQDEPVNEDVPTPQIPQVTSLTVETPPEREECEPISLEWKEENMEVVHKETLPVPQEEQPKEGDPATGVTSEPAAAPIPVEHHATPPNTPNPPEDEEEAVQDTTDAPTSCPEQMTVEEHAKAVTFSEPITPIAPSSIQLEPKAEETPTETQSEAPKEEEPTPISPQPTQNGNDTTTIQNGSHDAIATPTTPQEEAPTAESPEVPVAPISLPLEQKTVSEQTSTRAAQNDEPKTTSIVEQKRAEIRFTQESPTRERPISPVLVPGKLKSSIAFFENLKNK